MKQKILTLGLVMFFTLFIKAEFIVAQGTKEDKLLSNFPEITDETPLYQVKEITKNDLINNILKHQRYILNTFNSTTNTELLDKFYVYSSTYFGEKTINSKEYKYFITNYLNYLKECSKPYRNIFTKEFKQQTRDELTKLRKKDLDKLLSLFNKKVDLTTNIKLNCIQSYQRTKDSFNEIKKIDKMAIKINQRIMSQYHKMTIDEVKKAIPSAKVSNDINDFYPKK